MSHDDNLIDIALGKDALRKSATDTKRTTATTESAIHGLAKISARKRWGIGLLIMSIVYLLFEMIFNASLVQVAGSGIATEDELTRVELLGRSLSGIGVSLLIADWILRGPLLLTRGRRWGSVCLVFIFTWPIVFFGQRSLVDNYLIEPSSAEQRQRAYYAQVIRQGLANNSIEIDGIPHTAGEVYSEESLTFIALFGSLLYADPHLIDKVETHTQAIIKKMVTDTAYKEFPGHYARYQKFRADLQNEYRRYAEVSNKLNKQKSTSSQEAEKAWRQVEQELSNGWREYEQGITQFNRDVNSKAEKLTPKLQDYFNRIAKCSKDSCRKSYNDRYHKEIMTLGAGYIEPHYWLVEEKISGREKLTSSLLTGVLTGGVSVALQGLSLATGGDGGLKDKRYYFYNDVQDIAKRLSLKLQPQFSAKAKGYPFGLSGYEQFRANPITAQQIIVSSKKKGINLPDTWDIDDRTTFDRVVDRKVSAAADSAWNNESRNSGFNLPPNLSWDKFQLHAEMQKRIRHEMGAQFYVNPMRADWNNKQFLDKVIEPNINKKTQELMAQLKREQTEYNNGGSMAEKSKAALRAILVPPISMGLSLLLIVLTLCNLPIKIWKLWAKPALTSTPSAGTHKKSRAILMRTGIATITPLVVVMVPLLFFSSTYLSVHHDKQQTQQNVVHYFMDQVSRQATPASSLALRWVMAAQPRFQPLGHALNESIQLLRYFDPLSKKLHQLDEHFFSIQYQPL